MKIKLYKISGRSRSTSNLHEIKGVRRDDYILAESAYLAKYLYICERDPGGFPDFMQKAALLGEFDLPMETDEHHKPVARFLTGEEWDALVLLKRIALVSEILAPDC